jgi:hypothetical protein
MRHLSNAENTRSRSVLWRGLTTWSAGAMILSWALVASATDDQPRYLHLALRAGLTTSETAPNGWWIDAGVLWQKPLSDLWYFTMEASLAVARSTGSRTLPYHNSVIDETNHERHFMSGIPLRTGLGIGQGTLGFELGAIAGVGWTDAQSNMCSHESGLRPILGGYLGPVLRIGGRYPTRLSVQVQSAWPISARCTNVPHDGSERNAPTWFTDPPPDPSLLAQVAVPLW